MACEIILFVRSFSAKVKREAIRGSLMSGDEVLKYDFRVFRPCVNIILRH